MDRTFLLMALPLLVVMAIGIYALLSWRSGQDDPGRWRAPAVWALLALAVGWFLAHLIRPWTEAYGGASSYSVVATADGIVSPYLVLAVVASAMIAAQAGTWFAGGNVIRSTGSAILLASAVLGTIFAIIAFFLSLPDDTFPGVLLLGQLIETTATAALSVAGFLYLQDLTFEGQPPAPIYPSPGSWQPEPRDSYGSWQPEPRDASGSAARSWPAPAPEAPQDPPAETRSGWPGLYPEEHPSGRRDEPGTPSS